MNNSDILCPAHDDSIQYCSFVLVLKLVKEEQDVTD